MNILKKLLYNRKRKNIKLDYEILEKVKIDLLYVSPIAELSYIILSMNNSLKENTIECKESQKYTFNNEKRILLKNILNPEVEKYIKVPEDDNVLENTYIVFKIFSEDDKDINVNGLFDLLYIILQANNEFQCAITVYEKSTKEYILSATYMEWYKLFYKLVYIDNTHYIVNQLYYLLENKFDKILKYYEVDYTLYTQTRNALTINSLNIDAQTVYFVFDTYYYNLQINYITFASSTSLDVFVNAKTIYRKHIYKHNNITIISMNQQDVYDIITSNDIDSEQLKESLLIAINNEVKNNSMIDSDNNDRFYENIDEVID